MGCQPDSDDPAAGTALMELNGRVPSDLARLFEFLALANRTAAANSVKALVAAPKALLDNSRLKDWTSFYRRK
ncbi:hypothetical protein M8494_32950 [Serratia ureilytica]